MGEDIELMRMFLDLCLPQFAVAAGSKWYDISDCSEDVKRSRRVVERIGSTMQHLISQDVSVLSSREDFNKLLNSIMCMWGINCNIARSTVRKILKDEWIYRDYITG